MKLQIILDILNTLVLLSYKISKLLKVFDILIESLKNLKWF